VHWPFAMQATIVRSAWATHTPSARSGLSFAKTSVHKLFRARLFDLRRSASADALFFEAVHRQGICPSHSFRIIYRNLRRLQGISCGYIGVLDVNHE
jgi:hypothetical protein